MHVMIVMACLLRVESITPSKGRACLVLAYVPDPMAKLQFLGFLACAHM